MPMIDWLERRRSECWEYPTLCTTRRAGPLWDLGSCGSSFSPWTGFDTDVVIERVIETLDGRSRSVDVPAAPGEYGEERELFVVCGAVE